MENATTIALSRLVAQSRAMDVTANNIANSATPGFRRERMIFADFMVRERAALPGGERALAYTADRATYRDRTPGSLTHTGEPLDVAIGGDGYFTVMTPRGPRLTRAGHFSLSATGGVVDDEGDAVLDTAGQPLQTGTTDTQLSIAADGTISSENGPLGKIGIVTAADSNAMKSEGGTLLSGADTTTAPVPKPKLIEGAVEGSNVQPAVELASMMTTTREFQFVTQFVQAESDRQKEAVDKIMQTHS